MKTFRTAALAVYILSAAILPASASFPGMIYNADYTDQGSRLLSTGDFDRTRCTYKGTPLYGSVKVVSSHADFDVRVVSSHEDLKVQVVDHFADGCGK